MKRSISLFLIISYCMMVFSDAMAIQKDDLMLITHIMDNIISANKGELNDIKSGDLFFIQKQWPDSTLIYGIGKVVVVQQETCALEVIEMDKQMQLGKGDVLINVSIKKNEVESILTETGVILPRER